MKKLLLVVSTLVFCSGAMAIEKETSLPTLPATKIINPQQGTAADYTKELQEQDGAPEEVIDELPVSIYEEEEEIPVTITQDSIREVIIDEEEEGELTETEIISDDEMAKQQKLGRVKRSNDQSTYESRSASEEEEEEDVDALPEEEDKSKEAVSGEVAQAAPASFQANAHGPLNAKGPRKSLFLNDYAPHKSPRMFGVSLIDSRSSLVVTGNSLQLQTPESPLGLATGNLDYVNEVMGKAGFNVAGIETDNVVDLVKLDAWIFPFMNVYVLGGHIEGHANVATNFSNYDPLLAFFGAEEDMTFAMDYSGNNYGGGITLAAPLGRHFFATLDYNYLRTDLDVLKGHVKAETITALLGAHLTSHINLFAGAQRIDIEQRVQGPIPTGILPADMTDTMIGQNATFTLNADSAKDVLPVLGASVAFNDHFNANLTANFDKEGRFDGQNVSLGYRF